MLIEDFELEILTPACEPGAERYVAKARLSVDISDVLPYLNATLSGASFTPAANALIWQKEGHKVAFRGREIDISGVESRPWAEGAVGELVDLVNRTWDDRDELTPSFETIKPLTPMAVFNRLPQTNCGECGEATCFNFALKMAARQVTLDDCPPLLSPQYAENLAELEAAIAAAGPAT